MSATKTANLACSQQARQGSDAAATDHSL